MNVVNAGTNIPDLITRKQVAELLHISLPTLDKHTNSGVLKSYKLGRRVLFRRSEIMPALQKASQVEVASYE